MTTPILTLEGAIDDPQATLIPMMGTTAIRLYVAHLTYFCDDCLAYHAMEGEDSDLWIIEDTEQFIANAKELVRRIDNDLLLALNPVDVLKDIQKE